MHLTLPSEDDISIHALVKRATFGKKSMVLRFAISIHALVKRATNLKLGYGGTQEISIHALVKRATRYLRTKERSSKYFNPRPREEGDQLP